VLCALLAAGAARGEPPVGRTDGDTGVHLAYGLTPGQVWRSTQTIVRETRVGGDVQRSRGEAVFRYRVGPAPEEGRVTLDAEFVSLRAAEDAQPFAPGAVRFRAVLTRWGRVVASTSRVGDVPPPAEGPGGQAPDAVAWRQMLRGLAEAWSDAVFWLPELPERALRPGDTFTTRGERPLGGQEPGVSGRQSLERTYTLRRVEDGRAHFELAARSRVETSTARSAVRSERETSGEAVFDLGLGMWTRHVARSRDRFDLESDEALPDAGPASATTTTTITMERLEAE